MDHIWLDKEAQEEPELVPLYGEAPPNHGDIVTYPLEFGLKPRDLIRMVIEESSLPNPNTTLINSLVQEWLFFGLLKQYFRISGLDVQRSDFITERDGRLVVTTAQLGHMTQGIMYLRLQRIHHAMMSGGSDRPDQSLVRIFQQEEPGDRQTKEDDRLAFGELPELLNAVQRILKTLLLNNVLLDGPNVFSNVIMVESLQTVAETVHQCRVDVSTIPKQHIWQTRFQCRGLCQVPLLDGNTEIYMAASLQAVDRGDHSHCTMTGPCIASNQTIQLPLHTVACGGVCRTIALTTEDLLALEDSIEHDSWGVLRFTSDSEDSADFKVMPNHTETVDFVAFSHVW